MITQRRVQLPPSISTISATNIFSEAMVRLGQRLDQVSPEARKATLRVTYTGPVVDRYFAALPALLEMTQERMVAVTRRSDLVPFALDFAQRSAWSALMLVMTTTFKRLPGQIVRYGNAPGAIVSIEENLHAQGVALAMLPQSYKLTVTGWSNSPGQRTVVQPDGALLYAWGQFTNRLWRAP